MGVFSIGRGKWLAILRKLQVAVACLLLGSCSIHEAKDPNDAPVLVATTTLAADALRHVAWKGARIEALMGPGTDPHLFKPSLSDVRKLSHADVIVAGGLHLEGKMAEVLHKLAVDVPLIQLADSVPANHLRFAEGASMSSADPHIWFDVYLWRLGVRGLGRRLALLYPQHAEVILYNTHVYEDSLKKLDTWVKTMTGRIKPQERILVTSHDAFSYFGVAYGYRVRTLQGISTLSDFGLKDVSELVQFLVDEKVPALYPETSMPPQTLDAIQEACARAGHKISLGKELYTDALDAPEKPAGTYIGMIRYNVNIITQGATH